MILTPPKKLCSYVFFKCPGKIKIPTTIAVHLTVVVANLTGVRGRRVTCRKHCIVDVNPVDNQPLLVLQCFMT